MILDSQRPDCLRAYFYTGHPFNHKVTYEAYKANEYWYRVLLAWSRSQGRLWFWFGETPGDYVPPEFEMNAVRIARQARFEHNETPIPTRAGAL